MLQFLELILHTVLLRYSTHYLVIIYQVLTVSRFSNEGFLISDRKIPVLDTLIEPGGTGTYKSKEE